MCETSYFVTVAHVIRSRQVKEILRSLEVHCVDTIHLYIAKILHTEAPDI